MTEHRRDDSRYDRPDVTQFLFLPRPEIPDQSASSGFETLLIPVTSDAKVGARFYAATQNAPVLLFFHGNGEIVADYHDLASIYTRMNVNFFPVDYRGYGISTGTPSATTMIKDSCAIARYAIKWLKDRHFNGSLVVMGRSLGSASALEVAVRCQEVVKGLIIESGFAFTKPLLQLLGVNTLGMSDKDCVFQNHAKIRDIHLPTLVIHAEFDHIIPFADGQYLYDNSPDAKKVVEDTRSESQ